MTTKAPRSTPAASRRCAVELTTPVSAWSKRDVSPPASGVSPTPLGGRTHVRGWWCPVRTTVSRPWSPPAHCLCGRNDARHTRDHARQCVVQTGRQSSNLGRKPDPNGRSHSRARLDVPRPNHGLTTVVTSGATPQRRRITHAPPVTTPVSAWSKRDVSPPTSGVSPTPLGGRTHVRGWTFPVRTTVSRPWSPLAPRLSDDE